MNDGMLSPQELIEILSRVRLRLCEAHGEKMKSLRDWETESERFKAAGDMYGWNFDQGMIAGANYVEIFFHRVSREIQDVAKEIDNRTGTALQERVAIRRREERRQRISR